VFRHSRAGTCPLPVCRDGGPGHHRLHGHHHRAPAVRAAASDQHGPERVRAGGRLPGRGLCRRHCGDGGPGRPAPGEDSPARAAGGARPDVRRQQRHGGTRAGLHRRHDRPAGGRPGARPALDHHGPVRHQGGSGGQGGQSPGHCLQRQQPGPGHRRTRGHGVGRVPRLAFGVPGAGGVWAGPDGAGVLPAAAGAAHFRRRPPLTAQGHRPARGEVGGRRLAAAGPGPLRAVHLYRAVHPRGRFPGLRHQPLTHRPGRLRAAGHLDRGPHRGLQAPAFTADDDDGDRPFHVLPPPRRGQLRRGPGPDDGLGCGARRNRHLQPVRHPAGRRRVPGSRERTDGADHPAGHYRGRPLRFRGAGGGRPAAGARGRGAAGGGSVDHHACREEARIPARTAGTGVAGTAAGGAAGGAARAGKGGGPCL
ncbi:Uncharacterized MFS-type transporter, partial [Arthrobacter sp. DR-2P]